MSKYKRKITKLKISGDELDQDAFTKEQERNNELDTMMLGNELSNEEQELERETYELQTMIDPGDPDKEREIYHMFPGTYEFTSDVYANIPAGHVGIMIVNKKMAAGGCSLPTTILEPGYKGLITGQFIANGGEVFLQPGTDIAELIVMKVEG